MHHVLPKNLTAVLADLSDPRLTSYRTFFGNPTDEELYGIYCWNDAISIRLMRLTGIIEIILRNRLHRELSLFAHTPGVSIGTPDSNNWYRFVLTPGTKAANILGKKCNGSISGNVLPHKVIAQMTYGFWPRLLQIEKTNGNVAIPWNQMIPTMFPNHNQKTPLYWSGQHERDRLFMRLDLIGDLRNRLAHFEPIWKFKELKDEWIQRAGHPVSIVSLAPSSVSEAIARLRLVYRRTTQLLFWLSKDRADDYMNSENHFCLDWLFSKEGFENYRQIGHEEKIRLGSLTKSWGLKLDLRASKSLLVIDKQAPVGRYYSMRKA
jgi:hypothetical protein